MSKRKTTDDFIKEATLVHNGKYDYSKVSYTCATGNVTIVCPEHGDFVQRAADHTNGHGCPKCAIKNRAQRQAIGVADFVRRAKEIHGDKYGYTNVDYKNGNTPVVITCHKHGDFKQRPSDHLLGHACTFCSAEKGKGIIFSGVTNSAFGMKNDPSYIAWSNLLRRCMDSRLKEMLPTYQDCVLCDEWKEYTVFRDWFYDPKNGYKSGYQLDKDILVKGNKIYSPATCCFVPKYINTLFKGKPKKDGLPRGVMKSGRRYRACFTANGHRDILYADSAEKAFALYKEMRETYIKGIAIKYYKRGDITKKVFNAMMDYEVDITD